MTSNPVVAGEKMAVEEHGNGLSRQRFLRRAGCLCMNMKMGYGVTVTVHLIPAENCDAQLAII